MSWLNWLTSPAPWWAVLIILVMVIVVNGASGQLSRRVRLLRRRIVDLEERIEEKDEQA
jgi:hypothetical protein